MELDLAGKHVLVTGASKGIGLATVKAFLAEGAAVTAVSRHSTPELDATGATFLSADLSTFDGPGQMVESALAHRSQLDVLVNNAGGGDLQEGMLGDPLGGAHGIWEQTFALNLYAAVRTIRAALPALIEARGAVVNVSSISTALPHTNPLPYSAAKAALNAFSRGLAETVAGQGVRVNVVTPGTTRTNLVVGEDGFLAQVAAAMGVEHSALLRDRNSQDGPITGELIDPTEIARVIMLLSSPTMPSAVGSNWAVHAGALKMPA